MTLITGPRKAFEARLAERRATWEQVRACVVREEGDLVTVDVDHPAYPHASRSVLRPGDLVSLVIARLGFVPAADCGCNAMRRQMNQWGWWGCWRRRAELVAWFVKKATEAGVAVDRRSVAGLIRTAIREAWAKRGAVKRASKSV